MRRCSSIKSSGRTRMRQGEIFFAAPYYCVYRRGSAAACGVSSACALDKSIMSRVTVCFAVAGGSLSAALADDILVLDFGCDCGHKFVSQKSDDLATFIRVNFAGEGRNDELNNISFWSAGRKNH